MTISLQDPNARKIRADALRAARAEGYHYDQRAGYWRFHPGRFEGEPFELAYFNQSVMEGFSDETLGFADADTCFGDLCTLSDWERAAFSVDQSCAYALVTFTDQGFLGLKYLTEQQAEKLRAYFAAEETE
jgi:hypothetical protein